MSIHRHSGEALWEPFGGALRHRKIWVNPVDMRNKKQGKPGTVEVPGFPLRFGEICFAVCFRGLPPSGSPHLLIRQQLAVEGDLLRLQAGFLHRCLVAQIGEGLGGQIAPLVFGLRRA